MESNGRAIQVTTDDLRRVVTTLEEERNTITSTYTSKIKPVLESSKECLKVSGVNFTTIQNTYSKNFKQVDTEIKNLTDRLTKVINTYTDLSSVLRTLFNKDFASKLNNLLGIK